MGQSIVKYCNGSTDEEPSNPIETENVRLLDEMKRTFPDLVVMEHAARPGFQKRFLLGRKLGEGAFASVYECGDRETKKLYACKVFDRQKLAYNSLQCALMEPYILQKVYHPCILRCHGFYKERGKYYMVMEELKGGDVFDKLASADKKYSEQDICRLVKMVLEAIQYMHARNIVHRDLKLENIMLDSAQENCTLKIVDFGFAVQLNKSEPYLTQVLGTPGYMAPEVIQGGPYGKPADVWSVGVIIYTLLVGYPPFHHDHNQDIERLFRTICCGFYFFDSPYWDDISLDAKDVITQMLSVEPDKRPTADQILKHPWFNLSTFSPKAAEEQVNLLKVLGSLRSFNRIMKHKIKSKSMSSSNNATTTPATVTSPTDSGIEKLACDKMLKFESHSMSDIKIDLEHSILLPTQRLTTNTT